MQGWKAWLPVVSLSFAAFIFVTTELVPVGLLPDISKGLGSTESETGLLVTVYAWMVAVMSLPLTVLTARKDRRMLMLWILGIFVASHAVAACAQSYVMLMLARMGISLGHAVFWAITTPLAVRLAPEGKRGQAIAVIVTGTSLAVVLGVPLGTMVGKYLGWRATFALIGIIAFCIMLVIGRLLPPLPSSNAGSLKSVPILLRRGALLKVYLLTVLVVTGHFSTFTYLRPFMEQVGGFDSSLVILLLLLLGGAGIIGSYLAGICAERFPNAILVIPLALLCLCLLLMTSAAASVWFVIPLCLVWGGSMSAVCLVFQVRIMNIASNAVDVALAISSGIFNIGIGGGAFVGSMVFVRLGIGNVGYTGAVFVGLAVLIVLATLSRSGRGNDGTQRVK